MQDLLNIERNLQKLDTTEIFRQFVDDIKKNIRKRGLVKTGRGIASVTVTRTGFKMNEYLFVLDSGFRGNVRNYRRRANARGGFIEVRSHYKVLKPRSIIDMEVLEKLLLDNLSKSYEDVNVR